MYDREKPEWGMRERILSVYEVACIGKAALAECITDAASWLDTKLADKINEGEEL